jgi:hypothetical protein
MHIHLESSEELSELSDQLIKAAMPVEEQKNTACCYAKSDKTWTLDPENIPWEAFHSLFTIPVLGDDSPAPVRSESACCANS